MRDHQIEDVSHVHARIDPNILLIDWMLTLTGPEVQHFPFTHVFCNFRTSQVGHCNAFVHSQQHSVVNNMSIRLSCHLSLQLHPPTSTLHGS